MNAGSEKEIGRWRDSGYCDCHPHQNQDLVRILTEGSILRQGCVKELPKGNETNWCLLGALKCSDTTALYVSMQKGIHREAKW